MIKILYKSLFLIASYFNFCILIFRLLILVGGKKIESNASLLKYKKKTFQKL